MPGKRDIPALRRIERGRPRFCLGSHLSIAGGVRNAISRALQLKFDTVQVFVKNQRQWKGKPLADDDVAAWHELLRENPDFGPPVAHATYLINMASGDRELFVKSRDAYADELQRCDVLDIPYLVVHPGSAGEQSEERAIANVARALNDIFQTHGDLRCAPLLEATAGQGSALGHRLEHLAAILEAVDDAGRIGVCLDTCHVFAAGYDIRDAAQYDAMIARADALFGAARIRCWHLNDSKRELGCRRDRHEHIGHGAIGNAGFRHVLADERFAGVPMILETDKAEDDSGKPWDAVNRSRLRRIAAKVTQR